MKPRQIIPQKKLEATAVRRSNASTRAASIDEEQEPTMRLSTAFIVVLLLHVVAIGGVYTFDAIKVNHGKNKSAEATTEAPASSAAEKLAPVSPAAALAQAGQNSVAGNEAAIQKAAHTTTQTATTPAKTTKANPSAKPTATAAADGQTVHIMEKGENPFVIAKQYGVNYEQLLKINNIEDPRRVPVGRKLIIPGQ